jgi:hypothetical protein
LSDPRSKTPFVLDDARKTSQFEGKKVKVTGTLDVANNFIHVDPMEDAA